MATFITRDKSGRVTSRKKFKPGTSSSPFRKKSKSSRQPTKAEIEKKAKEIGEAFAAKFKTEAKARRSSGSRSKQTTKQTLDSLTSSQRQQLENLKGIQTSARTEIAARREREAVAKKKSSSKRKQEAVSFIKSLQATPQQLQRQPTTPVKDLKEKLKVKTISKTKEQKLKQLATTKQTITQEQKKEIVKLQTRESKADRILKELIPFLNPSSKATWKKVKQGKSLNLDDAANIAFDLISIIPGAGFVGRVGGKLIRTGSKTLNIGKISKSVSVPARIIPPSKANILANTSISIIKDVGATKRVTEGARQFFDVDNAKLRDFANKAGFKNDKELYNAYISNVGAKTKDGKFKTDDITNFVGIDYFNKSTVKNGQREFSKFLSSKNFTSKQIEETLKQLENSRKGRQLGQLFGLVRVEVSSERLARDLIGKGVGRKKAIALAGAREGVSSLLTEGFIQGYNLNPSDFALAVVSGVTGSLFFSKVKLKDIKPKDLDKAQNKITNAIFKDVSEVRKNRYTTKIIKANAKFFTPVKLTTKDIKTIRNGITQAEKDKLVKAYIKTALVKARGRIPTQKEKLILRDPIAHLIDPFEKPGDLIADLQEALRAKLTKKGSILKSKVKRGKVRTKALSTAKAKGKAVTKTKAKGKAVTKTKPTGKALSTAKAKGKAVTKTKPISKALTTTKSKVPTKTTTKPTTKPTTKTTTKSKATTKPTTKPTTKTIVFPIVDLELPTNIKKLAKGFRLSYNVQYLSKGKKKTLTLKLPKNKALAVLSKLIDNTTSRSAQLRIAGITKKKDGKLSKTLAKKFRIRRTKKALSLVEKRKFGIDTPGEQKGLTIAKAVKKLTKPKKKVVKRKSKKQVKRKSQPKKRKR